MSNVNCPSSVPRSVKEFLEAFYRASDAAPSTSSPSDPTHQAYASFFADETTLHMGPTTATSKQGIAEWRVGGWDGIASRHHIVENVFPAGSPAESDDQVELMNHGTVEYGLKAGGKGTADWAARMVLKKIAQDWKIAFYQVYIVSRCARTRNVARERVPELTDFSARQRADAEVNEEMTDLYS
jgi:hypothetical protein